MQDLGIELETSCMHECRELTNCAILAPQSEDFACQDSGFSQISKLIVSTSECGSVKPSWIGTQLTSSSCPWLKNVAWRIVGSLRNRNFSILHLKFAFSFVKSDWATLIRKLWFKRNVARLGSLMADNGTAHAQDTRIGVWYKAITRSSETNKQTTG